MYITDSLKVRFGVTSVIKNYIGHIHNENIHIDILAYDDSEQAVIDELKTYGVNIYFMPKLSFKTIFKFISFIKSFFKHNKYQIVHSHFNQIDSMVFPIAKKYGVKHCISHSHSSKNSDYLLRAFRNYIMCSSLPYLADTWAACSDVAGIFLFGKNFKNSKKKLIINNAIKVNKFVFNKSIRKTLRNSFDLSDDEIVIGMVGSIKPVKNHVFFLNVFKKLLEKSNKYRLIIVGDGELKKEIELKSNNLKIIDKIIFTGIRQDVNNLLQAFDIFVLPSLYEGLPVSAVEAQANGLPCLLSDKITKEVDVVNTRYLSIDNVNEWIEEILLTKCDNRQDCSQKIINAGFDITTEAQKLANFYLKISNE